MDAEGGKAVAGPFRRLAAWMRAHPLLVVALVAGVVAVGHGTWIWTHREAGAIDPDEAGYIATALRYQRLSTSDPLALPRAIGGTGFGPMVPVLSVPLLWIGPDDPRTALLTQPLMMVVTAVAAAGIARRLAGPWAAIAAGCAVVGMPTMVFASQTYWLGLGAAMFLTLGIWALLASERLTNRWLYAYGACIGAMLLCRTMTLGYIPGALLAGAVLAGRSPRSWIGLAKATAIAALVAVPWYVLERATIFGYLFSYGYGERAGLFGDGGLPERIVKRLSIFVDGTGPPVVIVGILLVASAVVAAIRWDGWPASTRSAVAVAVVAGGGFAALCSTTNNGVWFELPVLCLLVPLVISLASRAPKPLVGGAIALIVVAGILQLASSWWIIPPERGSIPLVADRNRTSQFELGFAEYDLRFRPERRDESAEAAAEWWTLSQDVERYLRTLTTEDQKVFTTSGNFEMFNTNTLQLSGELDGWTPLARIPDTVRPASEREEDLTPTVAGGSAVQGRQVERILVIALHDQHLFTPDAEVRSFDRQARDAGWEDVATFPIPGGGTVHVLRLPEGEGPD